MFETAILIPLFNNKRYLRKCLDSIDIKNLNAYLIICNDCSTEDVEEILIEYFKRFNKKPILIDEKNHKIENHLENKIHYLKHWKNQNIMITRIDLINYCQKLNFNQSKSQRNDFPENFKRDLKDPSKDSETDHQSKNSSKTNGRVEIKWVGWCDPDDFIDNGYYNELIERENECLEKGKLVINALREKQFPRKGIYIIFKLMTKIMFLETLLDYLRKVDLKYLIVEKGEDMVLTQPFLDKLLNIENKKQYNYNTRNPKSISKIKNFINNYYTGKIINFKDYHSNHFIDSE